MNILRTLSYLIAFLAFTTIKAFQNPEMLGQKLNAYLLVAKPEKVYVHTDKPYYGAGETIWFKMYLVDAIFHQFNTLSSVMYLELIDQDSKIIQRKVLKVKGGGANGDFALPRDLKPGAYMLRGYTNWMLNFDFDFFYSKSFRVIDPGIDEKSEVPPETKITLTFFPEGGDLIQGIGSKIAFKATDFMGNGIDVAGKIINSKGDVISRFKSSNLGMGIVFIQPQPDDQLRAILDNRTDGYMLPEIKPLGCAMKLIHSYGSDEIIVTLAASKLQIKDGVLLVHQRGQILFMVKNLNEETFVVKIKRSDLPVGICHFTFFNSINQPLAERLIFANIPETNELLKLSTDKEKYKRRQLVTLNYSLPDSLLLKTADLSLAVTSFDEIKYPDHAENIKNYLLLSSDLKGKIESPEYYFSDSKEAYNALDNLMLTQGWRRFLWENVLHGAPFGPNYWPESGISIHGRVVDDFKKDLGRKGTISMTRYDNGVQITEGETGDDGDFLFLDNQFYDSTQLLFQAKGYKKNIKKLDEFVSVEIMESDIPEITFRMPTLLSNLDKFEEQFVKRKEINDSYFVDSDSKLLEEFTVTADRLKMDPISQASKLYAVPSNRLLVDDLGWKDSAGSIFDLIRALPGVLVSGTIPNQSAMIARNMNTINSSLEPLYLLNGIPVDGGTLNTLNPRDVLFIDVLKGSDAAIYGARGSGGVIAVYMQTGYSSNPVAAKGTLNYVHSGYSPAREFYAPNYVISSPDHHVPDFRSTLYWNPILPLESGKGEVSFYSSDQTGTFEIRVEGQCNNGATIFLSRTFNVE
jgi:hypothetical protein